MAFPTIPTGGRILTANQLDTIATRTFPSLSGLTKNSGDLLIAVIVAYQTSTGTDAAFSGWTGGFTEFHDSATASTMAIGCAYKWSTGSETGTFAVTQAATITGDASMIVMSIAGAHLTTPPEAGGRASNTTALPDPTSFDPSGWASEDTLWINVIGSGCTNISSTWTGTGATAPTNYSSLVRTSATDTSVIGDCEAAVSFRQNNASSEDAGTASAIDITNARSAALTIAVRPGVSATVAPAAIATTIAAPAVTIVAGSIIIPDAIAATITLPAATATGGAAATAIQEGFRWRNDDGSETGATWLAAQDTDASVALDTPARLRVLLDTAGDVTPTAYTLHYKKSTDSIWEPVPVGAGGPASGIDFSSFPDGAPSGFSTLSGGGDLWIASGVMRVHLGGTPTDGYFGKIIYNTPDDDAAHIFEVEASFTTTADVLVLRAQSDVAEASFTSLTVNGNGTYAGGYESGGAAGSGSCTLPSLGVHFNVRFEVDATGAYVWTINGGTPITGTFSGLAGTGTYSNLLIASGTRVHKWGFPTGISPGAINPVYVATSANITAGGEATTALLTAPSGKTTGDFSVGRMWDDENGDDTVTISGPAFTPTDITGLIGWWDAADGATITASAGAVSQWNDKASSPHHATQASGSLQPTTGTRTINGSNALDFTGDYLASSSFTQAQPVTVFAVAQSDTTSAGNNQIVANVGGSPTVFSASNKWALYAGTVMDTGDAIDTAAHAISAVFNGASSQFWLDGVSIGTGNAGSGGFGSGTRLGSDGAGNNWDGLIAEVIVYNTALSGTDRQSVEAYLKDKWATP